MKLIDEANQWWKLWSVRLAAIPALVAGYLTAYPGELPKLIAYVPEDLRPLGSVLITGLVFGVPTLVRLMKQTPKECDNG